MKFHISPVSGRANICRAEERACPIGGEHFSSKEEAQNFIEQKLSEKLPLLTTHRKVATKIETIGAPWEIYPLLPTEERLLRKRLRGEFTPRELKAMKIDAETPAHVSFNRNGRAAFSYEDEETQELFTKGACGYIAYALQQKTKLPILVLTDDSTSDYWQGHVALKLGEDSYLDISGVATLDELRSYHRLYGRNFSSHETTDDESFKESMGIKPDVGVYDSLNELERALLERYSRDLIRDYIQNASA